MLGANPHPILNVAENGSSAFGAAFAILGVFVLVHGGIGVTLGTLKNWCTKVRAYGESSLPEPPCRRCRGRGEITTSHIYDLTQTRSCPRRDSTHHKCTGGRSIYGERLRTNRLRGRQASTPGLGA
jgi:hypothetical protein